jgi:DNA-binding CsgD family transcriptional regulator
MGFQPPAGQFGIQLDIEDEGLRRSLALAIEGRPGIYVAEETDDIADVVVTDRPVGADPRQNVLSVVSPGSLSPLAENTVLASDLDVAVSAAHLVAAGYLVRVAANLTGFDAQSPIIRQNVGLTPREREVLELLVAGASNKLIARRLRISTHTAKFHVTSLMGKLQARSRSEAVAIALRGGLVVL